MIINSGVQETAKVIGEVDTSNSMRMNLTAQSYSLILENLYKDPLGAVLRELTTNAVEAHQMANNTAQKVAIQLPTLLNTDLIIRDFGTGLTDEEIEKYLNCLFSSSKGEDNDSMGGFGLGSKSPLALVDSFTLVSVKNGIQYDYMWIKEKGQIPTPIYQGSSKTTKENGITITVPLGSSTKVPLQSLQRYVATSANRQLFAFQDQVMIVADASVPYADMVDISSTLFTAKRVLDLPNISIYYDTAHTSNSNTGYFRNRNFVAKSYIQIGSVIYDYEFSNIDFSKFGAYFTNIHQFVVTIKAPIGSLDLPMSREEVNITAENNKVITECFNKGLKDIEGHMKTLSFNRDCTAKEYYSQIKQYSQNTSAESLKYKLYPDTALFKVREKETIELYKDYASKVIDGLDPTLNNSNIIKRLDKAFDSIGTFTDPSYDLLYHFRLLPKEVFYFTQLFSSGLRENGSILNSANEKYTYFFTTSRLPGNIRYKDLYQFIVDKHPGTRPMLIQTPNILDPKLVKVFKEHLQNLIDFYGSESFVMDPVSDQVLKDYAKAKKTAATGSIMSTADYSPGVRLIRLSDISPVGRPSGYQPTLGNKGLCTVGALSGSNDYKIHRRVDDKGATLPQGPSYLEPKDIVLLTDTENVLLDLRELPNTRLTKEAIKFSLENVVIYKVPTKTIEKTEKLLKDAGHTVYRTPDDISTAVSTLKAKLPSFKDLTDYKDETYIKNAAAFVKNIYYPYFQNYGWRVDKALCWKRVEVILKEFAKTYDGNGKADVVRLLTNKDVLAEVQNAYHANKSLDATLSIESNVIADSEKHFETVLLKLLKSDFIDDIYTVNSSLFDNKIYSSRTITLYLNNVGFSL